MAATWPYVDHMLKLEESCGTNKDDVFYARSELRNEWKA